MPTCVTRPTQTPRMRGALQAMTAIGVFAGALAAFPGFALADTSGMTPSPSAPAAVQGDIAGEWPLDAGHFDAQKIWQISRGAGVTVAVVDSGVDAAHPDLAGQVLAGASLLGDGGDGRSDTSSESHGTAIAALIAGTGVSNHRDGIIGLAPAARILPVRVATGSQVTPDLLAQGIIWAADHGAGIINVSLGSADPYPLLKKAVAYAEGKDAVVVASAGNNGQNGNEVEYPAGFPGVVAVSGTDQTGAFWPTSESGPAITVAAPATQIASASDNGQYVQADGTSYAAGYVSAALALIRSHNPHLTAGQAITALISTTRDHRATPDNQLGYGEIDPLAALNAPVPTAVGNPLLAARPTASSARARWWWIGLGATLAAGLAGLSLILVHRRRSQRSVAAPVASRPDTASRNKTSAKQRPPVSQSAKTGGKRPPQAQRAGRKAAAARRR